MRSVFGGIVVAGLALALVACGEDSPGSDFGQDAADAVSPQVGDCVVHADRDCSNMDLSGGALSGGSAHPSNFSGATLSDADLAFHRADMSFGAEPGRFKLFVGGSSDTTNEADFELVE